ncbi:hypothetical protein [Acuticoccus sediminis]|uniref:hypothetical protein n=1 Tax=Acuticoccus sediminis TaxID=2184697 RepID=UPI00192E7341|nr:hypothetical protein [Acuticoccus sediminis]
MINDPRDRPTPKTDDKIIPGQDETTADYDEAELDEAIEESFPASDPLPPPTRAGD